MKYEKGKSHEKITVNIRGIDIFGNEVCEKLTLSGTKPVTSKHSYRTIGMKWQDFLPKKMKKVKEWEITGTGFWVTLRSGCGVREFYPKNVGLLPHGAIVVMYVSDETDCKEFE